MKTIFYFLAVALTFPLVVAYWLLSPIGGRQRLFSGISQLVSLIPGTTGVFLRWGFYRQTVQRCGRDAYIGFGVLFSHPTVKIGKSVYVGPYCLIGDVDLQDDCILASGVSVCNGRRQHDFSRLDVSIREQGGEYVPITVGRDSWIGERAVVMANVGEQAIVAAGAVVCEDVPARAIAVGNPAQVKGFRTEKRES